MLAFLSHLGTSKTVSLFCTVVAPCPAVQRPPDTFGVRFKLAVAATATVVAIILAVRPRRRRARCAAAALPLQADVPGDYRAAGVIFFTRDVAGDVAHVLLGVEERKVSLRELGVGSGTAKKHVLLFPQGKRELSDRGFVDTARREFVEETADLAGLADHLETAAAGDAPPPPAVWFVQAKMAVLFCEVPGSSIDIAPTTTSTLPLRPVWVAAGELRRALASASNATEVKTELGWFALFPMTRRFLQTSGASQWLGTARPRVARWRG